MKSLLRRFALDPATDTAPATGYWLFAAHLLSIWGLALSNACMALAGLWSLKNRSRLSWSWQRDAPLLVPAGLYMVFFCVSVVTSLEPALSAGELKDLLSWITLGLAPVLVRGEALVRKTVDALLAMILLLAAHGIGQYYLTAQGGLHHRIVGLFSHYQTFAGVLLVGTLILAARLATHEGWKRPSLWLALALLIWTLQLSLTRGAWLAAAVTLALLVFVRARRYFWVTMVVAVLFFSFLAPDSWTERWQSITDLSDVSNYDRLCMAEAASHMIAERPLFGIGPEVVEARYPIYRHPTAPRTSIPHLHNTFLQRAAEQGLMGLAAFLALMLTGILLAWRGLRQGGLEGPRADLYLAVILVLVGFNVAGLFEDNWRDTEIRRLVQFIIAVPLCLTPTPGPSVAPEDAHEP